MVEQIINNTLLKELILLTHTHAHTQTKKFNVSRWQSTINYPIGNNTGDYHGTRAGREIIIRIDTTLSLVSIPE